MTNKDIEITTVAIVKSVIESGAPRSEWKEMVAEGINLYINFSNSWKEQTNGKQ